MHPLLLAAAMTVSALAAPPAAAAGPPAAASWSLNLSIVDGNGVNVVAAAGGVRLRSGGGREGTLIGRERRLAAAAGLVTAVVDAGGPAGTEVALDVRGRRPGGMWSEWTPVPAVPPQPWAAVQARLTLRAAAPGITPVVHGVRLTAVAAALGTPSAAAAPYREPLTFRVFATREGLVGRVTANGHVIAERDQFVALPSRRALAGRDTGEYTARVCAPNGRCAWVPVWDVGPWNSRDDYWNPSRQRQMWPDLPHGMPQAQAAFRDGHHGGLDQFGRTVLNPAGVDLADGTFWDALGLTTNAWVTIGYLWTGSGPAATVVTPGDMLNVRSGAGTRHPIVGLAADRAQLLVQCRVAGERVTGSQGSSSRWLRIAPGKYVSAAYVGKLAVTPPPCG
jgi:hypothetical protein